MVSMTEKVEGAVIGRPTKYRPEYCERIIEFFDRDPIETREVIIKDEKGDPALDDKGEVKKRIVTGPCQCPTFEKFSADLSVSRSTLMEWTKSFPEFQVAYTKARGMQANIMMVNGMSGAYNAAFTNLSMKNMHGWRDKSEVENNHIVHQMPSVSLNGKTLEFDVGEPLEIEDKDE